MNLRKTVVILGITLVVMTGTSLGAATPEESFRKNFPDIRLDSITPTAVTGLYEIVSEGRIAYYAPGPEYLIPGSLITKERRNLTEERAREIEERAGESGKSQTPLEQGLENRERSAHGDRNHGPGLHLLPEGLCLSFCEK